MDDSVYLDVLNSMASAAGFQILENLVVVFIRRFKPASSDSSLPIYLHLRVVTRKSLIATPAAFNTDFDCLMKF